MVSGNQERPPEIIYADKDILVCIKPPRVLSTDEPGGLPSMIRTALGDETADVRTVHRLDRVVSGVMVLARNPKAASELSRQIREDEFEKEYLAVVHGRPEQNSGTLTDLLYRDKARKMTMVAGLCGSKYRHGYVPGTDSAANRQNPPDSGSVCQPQHASGWGAEILHSGRSL